MSEKPKKSKRRLLFHICCASCSGLISRLLSEQYDVTAYFDNPNIWPEEEFSKRSAEAEKFFTEEGVKFILAAWNHDDWLELVKGMEQEPEKGRRCKLCYHRRLENAARFAADSGFDYFTTSLSISPHKDARAILNLGRALGKKYGVKFLDQNFSQNGGFLKSVEFSKANNFYRQKYCGCEYGAKSVRIKL